MSKSITHQGRTYRKRKGLEGPFLHLSGPGAPCDSGVVLYYDKAEGLYYDSAHDLYIDPPGGDPARMLGHISKYVRRGKNPEFHSKDWKRRYPAYTPKKPNAHFLQGELERLGFEHVYNIKDQGRARVQAPGGGTKIEDTPWTYSWLTSDRREDLYKHRTIDVAYKRKKIGRFILPPEVRKKDDAWDDLYVTYFVKARGRKRHIVKTLADVKKVLPRKPSFAFYKWSDVDRPPSHWEYWESTNPGSRKKNPRKRNAMTAEELARGGRTARGRGKPSRPMVTLVEAGVFRKRTRILDFGCGRGDDARFLAQTLGYDTVKLPKKIGKTKANGVYAYDPTWGPCVLTGKYDTVYANYVLNVIPKKEEKGILKDIVASLLPGGEAFIAVRGDVKKHGEEGEVISPGTDNEKFQRDVHIRARGWSQIKLGRGYSTRFYYYSKKDR